MQAAMRLALRGGFAAMTVRQIAREAEVAAGQLHHHFSSIGELKSQVFIRLIREMLDMPLVAEDASWRERLFSMIGSEDGRLGLACGEFHSSEPPADIAWRFIALVCGLDGIYALGTQALDDAAFSRYLNKMITMELF